MKVLCNEVGQIIQGMSQSGRGLYVSGGASGGGGKRLRKATERGVIRGFQHVVGGYRVGNWGRVKVVGRWVWLIIGRFG